jgi:hypothetical protein
MDETKIKTIKEWSIPKTVNKERIFHGLVSIYKRFEKNLVQ